MDIFQCTSAISGMLTRSGKSGTGLETVERIEQSEGKGGNGYKIRQSESNLNWGGGVSNASMCHNLSHFFGQF